MCGILWELGTCEDVEQVAKSIQNLLESHDQSDELEYKISFNGFFYIQQLC